ncbi:MAG TPA: cation:proton antiporter [Thermoplasmata archaeon]|nr:cation:proton antiporter [Thermoplasmata archaeon]
MSVLDPVDLDLVLVFGTVVVTALLARRTRLPITALEILAGILLVAVVGFQLPAGTTSIIVLGGLFIVFLAGFETGFGFLRANLRRALTVGLAGFVGPFVGLFLALDLVVHAPFLVSLVGATVLADTSISITYTTLQQFDLTELPFGRLVLASTLCVNLAEDSTITISTVLTTPGFLFTVGVLLALALAAYLLPRLAKAVEGDQPGGFSNIAARSLLLSLAVLALLSALVGVPGILFVFLMGLVFSQLLPKTEWGQYLDRIRPIAFALFIPLYFVAVGLKVDPGFVLAHWSLLLALIGLASLLKIASLLPAVRAVFGPARTGPIVTLMNARLTSATVILTLTLALGLITAGWYSVFISVVVVLALVASAAVRSFPAFRDVASARALFAGGEESIGIPGESAARPTPLSGKPGF